MRPPRRLPALLAAGLTVALLAGCSDDPVTPVAVTSPSPSPAENVGATFREAAAKTDAEGSSRYEVMTATTVNGTEVVFSGEGIYDWKTDTGQTTYEVPGGKVLQRLIGNDLYLALPQQPKDYFKLRTVEVAQSPVGGIVDPSAQLHLLAAVAEAERVGPEQVRGTPTTHYRGTYEVGRALKGARGVQQPALRSLLGVAASQTKAPYDVFLSKDGLLRRLRQSIEVPPSAATGGQTLTVTTSLELYDFGIDVTVIPPPGTATRDGAPLLAALRNALPKPKPVPSVLPSAKPSIPTPSAPVAVPSPR